MMLILTLALNRIAVLSDSDVRMKDNQLYLLRCLVGNVFFFQSAKAKKKSKLLNVYSLLYVNDPLLDLRVAFLNVFMAFYNLFIA